MANFSQEETKHKSFIWRQANQGTFTFGIFPAKLTLFPTTATALRVKTAGYSFFLGILRWANQPGFEKNA